MIAILLSSLVLTGVPAQPVRPMPSVTNLAGKTISPMSFESGQKAAVFIFSLSDCPNANTYVPEVIRIASAYGKKNVKFYYIYEDPDITTKAAASHAKAYGINFATAVDTKHTLASRVGADRSPQAVVVLPDQKIAYFGRIDDRYVALGKKRRQPTRHDLRVALDEVLAGKSVTVAKTTVIGCVLPR